MLTLLCPSSILRQNCLKNSALKKRVEPPISRALLNGGERNGGCMRHLCGKQLRTFAPHKWHTCLPSNHFLCCVKMKARCVISASFACHREKNVPPIKVPPIWKCPNFLDRRNSKGRCAMRPLATNVLVGEMALENEILYFFRLPYKTKCFQNFW